MTRQFVKSSNLRSVGYENGVLEVEFISGAVYQYYDVPVEVFRHMIFYSHPGTYLADRVKGVYRYRRVR